MKTLITLTFALIAGLGRSQPTPAPVAPVPPSQPAVAPVPAPPAAGYGYSGSGAAVAVPSRAPRLASVVTRSSRSSVPPVVVQFSSKEEKTVPELSEDLDV